MRLSSDVKWNLRTTRTRTLRWLLPLRGTAISPARRRHDVSSASISRVPMTPQAGYVTLGKGPIDALESGDLHGVADLLAIEEHQRVAAGDGEQQVLVLDLIARRKRVAGSTMQRTTITTQLM
jgi:hypothetical protein